MCSLEFQQFSYDLRALLVESLICPFLPYPHDKALPTAFAFSIHQLECSKRISNQIFTKE